MRLNLPGLNQKKTPSPEDMNFQCMDDDSVLSDMPDGATDHANPHSNTNNANPGLGAMLEKSRGHHPISADRNNKSSSVSVFARLKSTLGKKKSKSDDTVITGIHDLGNSPEEEDESSSSSSSNSSAGDIYQYGKTKLPDTLIDLGVDDSTNNDDDEDEEKVEDLLAGMPAAAKRMTRTRGCASVMPTPSSKASSSTIINNNKQNNNNNENNNHNKRNALRFMDSKPALSQKSGAASVAPLGMLQTPSKRNLLLNSDRPTLLTAPSGRNNFDLSPSKESSASSAKNRSSLLAAPSGRLVTNSTTTTADSTSFPSKPSLLAAPSDRNFAMDGAGAVAHSKPSLLAAPSGRNFAMDAADTPGAAANSKPSLLAAPSGRKFALDADSSPQRHAEPLQFIPDDDGEDDNNDGDNDEEDGVDALPRPKQLPPPEGSDDMLAHVSPVRKERPKASGTSVAADATLVLPHEQQQQQQSHSNTRQRPRRRADGTLRSNGSGMSCSGVPERQSRRGSRLGAGPLDKLGDIKEESAHGSGGGGGGKRSSASVMDPEKPAVGRRSFARTNDTNERPKRSKSKGKEVSNTPRDDDVPSTPVKTPTPDKLLCVKTPNKLEQSGVGVTPKATSNDTVETGPMEVPHATPLSTPRGKSPRKAQQKPRVEGLQAPTVPASPAPKTSTKGQHKPQQPNHPPTRRVQKAHSFKVAQSSPRPASPRPASPKKSKSALVESDAQGSLQAVLELPSSPPKKKSTEAATVASGGGFLIAPPVKERPDGRRAMMMRAPSSSNFQKMDSAQPPRQKNMLGSHFGGEKPSKAKMSSATVVGLTSGGNDSTRKFDHRAKPKDRKKSGAASVAPPGPGKDRRRKGMRETADTDQKLSEIPKPLVIDKHDQAAEKDPAVEKPKSIENEIMGFFSGNVKKEKEKRRSSLSDAHVQSHNNNRESSDHIPRGSTSSRRHSLSSASQEEMNNEMKKAAVSLLDKNTNRERQKERGVDHFLGKRKPTSGKRDAQSVIVGKSSNMMAKENRSSSKVLEDFDEEGNSGDLPYGKKPLFESTDDAPADCDEEGPVSSSKKPPRDVNRKPDASRQRRENLNHLRGGRPTQGRKSRDERKTAANEDEERKNQMAERQQRIRSSRVRKPNDRKAPHRSSPTSVVNQGNGSAVQATLERELRMSLESRVANQNAVRSSMAKSKSDDLKSLSGGTIATDATTEDTSGAGIAAQLMLPGADGGGGPNIGVKYNDVVSILPESFRVD